MNTALFWQSYLTSYGRFAFIAMIGIIVFSILSIFKSTRSVNRWAFLIGYILADPFSYYFINYHPK